MVKVSKFINVLLSKIPKENQVAKQAKDVTSDAVSAEKKEIVLSGYETSNLGNFAKYAIMQSHKDIGGTIAYAYPNYYTKLVERVFVEAQPERETFSFGKTRKIPAKAAYWDETRILLPHYHIDKLWSTGKGSGQNSVKDIVRKSIKDQETRGRVTLDACCIDGKTCPGGFYYKLGFRFKDPYINKQFENWLKNGGNKEDAPFYTGDMFLPKENISKCLNY